MDRAPRLTRERLAVLAGLLMLAGYAAFLHHHTAFSVGGADSAGYLSATRALLEGRILRPIPALRELDLPMELDRLFIPLGSAPAGNRARWSPDIRWVCRCTWLPRRCSRAATRVRSS